MAERNKKAGARLAYESGVSLLESAGILESEAKYGHAFLLGMFGIEELAKAEIYAFWAEGDRAIPNLEKLLEGEMIPDNPRAALTDHRAKYRRFAYYLRMSQVVTLKLGASEARRLCYVATTDDQLLKARRLDKARQDAVYVDYRDRDGRWSSPDRFKKNDASFLLMCGRRYAKWVERTIAEGWKASAAAIQARLGEVTYQEI